MSSDGPDMVLVDSDSGLRRCVIQQLEPATAGRSAPTNEGISPSEPSVGTPATEALDASLQSAQDPNSGALLLTFSPPHARVLA